MSKAIDIWHGVHGSLSLLCGSLCAFSVSSVSGMDRSRELCVAMSPCIARLLFNTEHTEKAQRATEFNAAFHAARKTRSVMEH